MKQESHKTDLAGIENALKNDPEQYLDFKAKEDLIEKILRLRDEKDILILGHNYMEPLVYQLSGKNERGDSLMLSMRAAKAKNPIILFDGVLFMAETAKILNPNKKVLIADKDARCSLADPFKASDVIMYKKKFPNCPVVTYINSYAEVKAESDYCCTSSNAIEVLIHAANEFGTNRVIFFPDSLMGENLQKELREKGHDIDVIYPGKYDSKFGRCEVHEKMDAETIRNIRSQFNLRKGDKRSAVLVHWECRPEVLEEADYYGSTSQMIKYIKDHTELQRVYLATECEMSANLANEFPNIEFVRTCQLLCQHMRRITLEKILHSLENEVYEVKVKKEIIERALVPIKRMLEITSPKLADSFPS